MLPVPAARPVPAADSADVWWLDIRPVTLGPDDLDELGPDERQAAAAFAFRADRHRYQVAHVMLRRVLAGYLDVAPERLTMLREPCPACGGPGGRPALPPGSGVHFSLAHGGDAVAVAVAGRPVGVDVEREPAGCVCSLASTMHAADAERVRLLAEPERHDMILCWWVRAEAVLKCTGEGIAHGLGSFPVLRGPADPADHAGRVHGCELRSLAAPPGYHAALALAGARLTTVTVCSAWGGDEIARNAEPGPG